MSLPTFSCPKNPSFGSSMVWLVVITDHPLPMIHCRRHHHHPPILSQFSSCTSTQRSVLAFMFFVWFAPSKQHAGPARCQMRSKPNGAGFKKVAYVRDRFSGAVPRFPMSGEHAEYTVCNISIYAHILVLGHHHIGFRTFVLAQTSITDHQYNCLHASTWTKVILEVNLSEVTFCGGCHMITMYTFFVL